MRLYSLYLLLFILILLFDQTQPASAQENNNFRLDGQTTSKILSLETICAMTRGRKCGNKDAKTQGLIETGLTPHFPKDAECRGIDDHFAMDYTHRRPREAYHGGIDMPAPYGEPIIAAASGTIIAKYQEDNSPRGIEIVLRHNPKDTGFPYWIYTQYTHFDEMPKHRIGRYIRMGDTLGPTGSSGLHPRRGGQHPNRRPAIHFAAFYSKSDKFVEHSTGTIRIIPVDFHWMDPLALYLDKGLLNSHYLKTLSNEEKLVAISIKFEDGEVYPKNTKLIWPYKCLKKSN